MNSVSLSVADSSCRFYLSSLTGSGGVQELSVFQDIHRVTKHHCKLYLIPEQSCSFSQLLQAHQAKVTWRFIAVYIL